MIIAKEENGIMTLGIVMALCDWAKMTATFESVL